MEPDQKYAAVGAFVVFAIIGIVIFTLWISGSLADRDKACYLMRFDNSVAGLTEGSQITFRGVNVGNVQRIRINPQNDSQILVRAALNKNTPIKPSTYAKLKPQGITGASYIELDIRDDITTSNQPSRIKGCRYIVTTPSGIEQIVNLLPQILDKTLQVTQRLSDILGGQNATNISETLANLRATTSQLNKATSSLNGGNVQDLQDTIRQTRAAVTEIRGLAEDLRTNPRRTLNTPAVKEEKVP